jgi:hypothetical protein
MSTGAVRTEVGIWADDWLMFYSTTALGLQEHIEFSERDNGDTVIFSYGRFQAFTCRHEIRAAVSEKVAFKHSTDEYFEYILTTERYLHSVERDGKTTNTHDKIELGL